MNLFPGIKLAFLPVRLVGKRAMLLFVFTFIISASAFCQPGKYWQQTVNYKIDVSLNDTAKTLDGYVRMQYFNHSPDTLRFIWFHIWPNAYKNDKTAFTDQTLQNGSTAFYFSDESKRGYLNRLDFKVDKSPALTEDHPEHQDIIKLLLPTPLAPGDSALIETPFHVKLPYNFSRGGFIGQSFQITQWYPKPAVYDRQGWHEMPYLDQGEFYSEFGEYDVQVTVPKAYVVASTGKVKNEVDNGDTKTLSYSQNNVHDFAWFADKSFIVKHDTLQLPTHTVDLYAYYHETKKASLDTWINSMELMKAAIRTKSNWIGEYPYDIVSVVEEQKHDGGGMEYPTVTLISIPEDLKQLDDLIYHEVGHNWFYGILGSNERQHPWMDEGMNTYYDLRYLNGKINTRAEKEKRSFIGNRVPEDFFDLGLRTITTLKKDQPIETSSENFSEINYGLIAYYKTGKWMQSLEMLVGRETFDSIMHIYFQRWKFKHPYPEDFKLIAEEISAKNLDTFFQSLHTKGYLPVAQQAGSPVTGPMVIKKRLKIYPFFNLTETDKYRYIFVSPAIGYNNYDKFMVGALLHNYSLPPTRFRFIISPLYATGSKQLNGIGNINFSTFSDKKIERLVIGVTAARFSTNQSLDTLGNKLFANFTKIVPSIQLYFKHSPRSHVTSWIDLRSYIINEQKLSNFVVKSNIDSTAPGIFYPQSTTKSNRYINQVSFNLQNTRVLYPYDYQLKLQQGKGFYRFDVVTNYFFNYAKRGGFQVRIFASKFGYLGSNHYDAYQYQPKLLAATGEEDYTYSNYFIGRTASTANPQEPVKNLGLAAQQVMIRDGGMKLRLDQYGYLQGRSENWVAAVNANTTIPDIFPVKIPLKLFLDVGTFSEAWKQNSATTKFLYVGGLQLSLFKNLLNIYAPLVYSKDFRNVLKTDPERNKFFKKVTFSINIQNISTRTLFPQIAF